MLFWKFDTKKREQQSNYEKVRGNEIPTCIPGGMFGLCTARLRVPDSPLIHPHTVLSSLIRLPKRQPIVQIRRNNASSPRAVSSSSGGRLDGVVVTVVIVYPQERALRSNSYPWPGRQAGQITFLLPFALSSMREVKDSSHTRSQIPSVTEQTFAKCSFGSSGSEDGRFYRRELESSKRLGGWAKLR